MESIIQKTDEWLDFVSIDKNLNKVINCFSDDATLFGTFSHILSQNKLIEEYFKHFLSIKGLKVINKKYNIQRISNEIFINNTFITWEVHDKPNLWKDTLIGIHNARKNGININGQVGSRPIGMLIGLESSINPFSTHPLWTQIKKLKPEDRFLKIKNDKLFRKKLIDDYPDDDYSRWFKTHV